MLTLSTSWNADRKFTAGGLLDVLRGFGLEAIELSYYHEEKEVAELAGCCDPLGIKIVSLHNFCPLPPAVFKDRAKSELFLLSSKDGTERRMAVEHTRRSIATAAEVGAKVLILHSGRVEIPSLTRDLIDLYRSGHTDSTRYRQLRDLLVDERSRRGSRYFELFVRSLEELCAEAQKAGILLAIENRFYYREIPSLVECREIMERFKGAPVGYLHDIGHAQVMEDLGFWRHEDLLEAIADRLVGFHIHDVLLCEDHMPPSSGDVDFRRFKRYWGPDKLKILELSPSHGRASVARGIEFINKEMAEKDI